MRDIVVPGKFADFAQNVMLQLDEPFVIGDHAGGSFL
jgi:hypothetical protein